MTCLFFLPISVASSKGRLGKTFSGMLKWAIYRPRADRAKVYAYEAVMFVGRPEKPLLPAAFGDYWAVIRAD